MLKNVRAAFMIIPGMFILCIAVLAAPLHASAVSMGLIDTVGSDLSLDALRNPALLPAQKSGKSMGFFLLGKAMYEDSNDGTVNAIPINVDNTQNIEANLFVSFVRNYGDVAWGIALGSVGTGQIAVTKDETTAPSYESKTERNTINPALFLSFGMRLAGTDFVGAQVRTAYSFNERKQEVKKGPDKQETNETGDAATFLLSLGYLKRWGNTQIGAMINSGTISVEQLGGENKFNNTTEDYSGDMQVLYISGPSLAVGTFTALNRYFAMVLELKLTLPVFFHRDEPNFSENSSAIKESDTRYGILPAVQVKGGFEFHITPYWVLCLGGGVMSSSVSIYARGNTNQTNKQRIMVALATAGIDYYFSRNTALTVGFMYTYIEGKLSGTNFSNGNKHDIDQTVHGLDVFIGFNFGW